VNIAEAKTHYARAVEAYREIGSGAGQGNSLTGFGNALIAAGDPAAAQAAWREAVVILDRLAASAGRRRAPQAARPGILPGARRRRRRAA